MDTSKPEGFALNLIITTIVTTIVWLIVTFATKPEPSDKLRAFYAKVRPAGGGWNRIAAELNLQPIRGEIPRNAVMWVFGIALVYSIMFATGALLFHQTQKLILFGAVMIVSLAGLVITMKREPASPLDTLSSRA